jgi:REP element-mobilizing transposase RayT
LARDGYNPIMSQTLTKLNIHAVFSTKNRRDQITSDIEPELYAYIGGVCGGHISPLLAIGGTANHLHLLVGQSKNISLADLMLNIKRDSSTWIKSKGPEFRDFYWQDGYAAFSVSESQLAAVTAYIAGQKEHHRRMTFEDELVAIAEKHGVAFDPRHLFAT